MKLSRRSTNSVAGITVGDRASYSSCNAMKPKRPLRQGFAHSPTTSFSYISCFLTILLALVFVLAVPLPSEGKKKDGIAWGEGLIVNIPLPEAEVAQVVGEIVANGIIRGTKEYNRDDFVTGAKAANTSKVFGEWKQGGEVFYKVREEALDPRNFKDSGDLGTLAVRYVLKPQGTKNTTLRIDAIFQEEVRHTVHQSNGSVESAEYRDIQDHLDFVELMKKQDAEAERERQERQERLARKQNPSAQAAATGSSSSYRPSLNAPPVADNSGQAAASSPAGPTEPSTAPQEETASNSPPPRVPQPQPSENAVSAPPPPASEVSAAATTQPQAETEPQPPTPSTAPAADSSLTASTAATASSVATQPDTSKMSNTSLRSDQSLKQHVEDLRRQVERVVKSPGAPLKSAPFHTAGTLQSLPPGTEVLIVISTPYWYGVETRDGQHGWMMRDELEQKR
jgi:hypothetical protein